MDQLYLFNFISPTLLDNQGPIIDVFFSVLILFMVSLVGLSLLLFTLRRILFAIAKWTKNEVDDFILETIFKHVPFSLLVFLSLYIATHYADIHPEHPLVELVLRMICLSITLSHGIQVVLQSTDFGLRRYFKLHKNPNPTRVIAVESTMKVLRVILWFFAVVFLCENLGFNIYSIITGLGIGGVAVALASQTIIRDMFTAFSIFIDQPFEVGEMIEFNEGLGTVEYIGFKSTRIRSSGGELLVVPNSHLSQQRIKNFRKLEKRKDVINIFIDYETSLENLKALPKVLKSIVEEKGDLTTFLSANFKAFGEYALHWELVYHVNSKEWDDFVKMRTFVHLRIREEFEKRGIKLSYPRTRIQLSENDWEKLLELAQKCKIAS